MTIIALIIALTLGGGTVAAAQNDNPGDALYGVKIASEAVADVAITATTGNESEIIFKEKLVARRAGELEFLGQRMGSAQEKKKIVLMNNIERTAERLEDNIDRISVKIKKLQLKNTEEAFELAARLSAKSEVYQGVMAEIENNPDIVSELKERMVAGQISMERFRAKTRAVEGEVKKRHLSEVGLENSAKGRVPAAENKMEVATKMREKAVSIIEEIEDEDKKLAMKEEFNRRDAFYQDGVKFTTDARAFLNNQQWEEAITNADHAFKVFVQFASPLGHRIRRVDVDIDAGVELVSSEETTREQDGMRRKAEVEFSRAFTRMNKLQLRAGQLNVEITSELLEKFEIAVRQAKAEYNKGAYSEAVGIVIQNGRAALDAIEAVIDQARDSGETESEIEDRIDIQNAIDKGWKELSAVGSRVFRVKEAGNVLPADVDTLMRSAKELLSSAEQAWGEQNESDALHTANKALKRVSGMLDLSSRKFGALTQPQAEAKIGANHALFQARVAHTELQNYALKFNSSFPNLKMSPSDVVVERGSAILRMAQKYYDDQDFIASISSANDAEKVFREEFQDFLRKTQDAFRATEPTNVISEIDNIESDDQPEILEKKKKVLEKKKEQTPKPAERNFAKEMATAVQLRARTAFQKYMTRIDELGREKVTLYMGRADQSMDAGDYSSAHKYYGEVVDVINAAVARISSGQSLPGSN